MAPDDRNAPSEQDFAARTNQERAQRGLAALTMVDDLVAVARRHSQEMADQKRLYHDPTLPNEVQGWQTLGENVGTGGSVVDVHQAFMASQVHRDEILDPRYTQIGIGVVWDGATLWVTEVFRQPEAPPPAPKPQPATAPAAAPPSPPPRQLASTPPPPPPRPAPAPPAPVAAPAPAAVAPAPQPAPRPVAAVRGTAIESATAADVAHAVPTEVKGVVRTRTQALSVSLPARVPRVPAPVGIAAALLSLVIALQGWVVTRLGLA